MTPTQPDAPGAPQGSSGHGDTGKRSNGARRGQSGPTAAPSSTAPGQSQVLTPKEASDLLKVNVKTIHAMLAQGLRHQRISTRIIRIRREDLLAWGSVGSLSKGIA